MSYSAESRRTRLSTPLLTFLFLSFGLVLSAGSAARVAVSAGEVQLSGWSGAASSGANSTALAPRKGEYSIPFFPSASGAFGRQGFARIVNLSASAGTVSITAFDDAGRSHGPIALTLDARQTVHFNSNDLEDGNAGKGLVDGTGRPSQGDWRLELTSDLDIKALSYIRTSDGFVTSMHDVAPANSNVHHIAILNPGSNWAQRSLLRLVNLSNEGADVTIRGVDDRGAAAPGGSVRLWIPPQAARTLAASELEDGGTGLEGSLGDGAGKWRLEVETDRPIMAISMLATPTGHLTNLSAEPWRLRPRTGEHSIPFFPSASGAFGRQGFARIVNLSASAGTVSITAFDDAGRSHGPIALTLDARQTVHFNSNDLEDGNAGKGLVDGTGRPSQGDWRLELTSDLDIKALSYIRTSDGFVTSMHDVAPANSNVHHIAILNPGSNWAQRSLLRLVNLSNEGADVTIRGVDDRGAAAPGGSVRLWIPPQAARTLAASELEDGGTGLEGSLGDGAGKWRLEVETDRPIMAISMLATPTGHLTNLSAEPWRLRPRTGPSSRSRMIAASGTTVVLRSTAALSFAPARPTCEWTQVEGPAVELHDVDSEKVRIAVPAVDGDNATLSFTAECTGGGKRISDMVRLDIVEKRTERTLSALVDFLDVPAADRPLTRQDLANLLVDGSDSLERYLEASSRGLVDVRFDVLDWVTVDKNRTAYPHGGGNVVEDVVAKLSEVADLGAYDKVLPAIYPLEQGYPGCKAYTVPITWQTPNGEFQLGAAWLSGYDMGCLWNGRIAHEYGHTFGFLHALMISCHTESNLPGSTIDPLDENDSCYIIDECANEDCTELRRASSGIVSNVDPDMLGDDRPEYYERYFPMHYQAFWQAQAGWLAEAQVVVAEATRSSWITSLEALTPTPKAIRVPLGTDHHGDVQNYWLESRIRYPGRSDAWIFTPCTVHVRLQANTIEGSSERNSTYRFSRQGWPLHGSMA